MIREVSIMEIKPMTEKTVPQVAALEKTCFSTPWSENSVRGELQNPLSIWLVAVEGPTLLGYLGVQTVMDEADVMNIATDPAHRERGAAKALLEEMFSRLISQGVKKLTLEVRPSNQAAIGLYERYGFREVGRRKNYYRNPREDALLMTKFFEEETIC